jgi:hypothetical protein
MTSRTYRGVVALANLDPLDGVSIEVYRDEERTDLILTSETGLDGAFAFNLLDGHYYLKGLKARFNIDNWAVVVNGADPIPTAIIATPVSDVAYLISEVRSRINVPEELALEDSAIVSALTDARTRVRLDASIPLRSETEEAAVITYAVYYAMKTYSTRGRHVTSGHQDNTGHFINDAPDGLFDFRVALKAASDDMVEMKARIRPRLPAGGGRRFG